MRTLFFYLDGRGINGLRTNAGSAFINRASLRASLAYLAKLFLGKLGFLGTGMFLDYLI